MCLPVGGGVLSKKAAKSRIASSFTIPLIICSVAVGTGCATSTNQTGNTPNAATSSLGASLAGNGSILDSISSAVNGIYNSAIGSICTITTVNKSQQKNSNTEDIGTGFFIDNNGDIATNDHVVGTAKTVTVTLGSKSYTGTVIGTDRLDDLAIVHVSPISGVKPLPLGTATTLKPGYYVIAIGNPFQMTGSVSSGIVSGINRSMPSVGGRDMDGLIQTDAPINPGNSGGPLLNTHGQVVGINTMIESPVSGSVGIGFAIPIDRLKKVLPNLLGGKSVEYPWLGITAVTINVGVQQQFQLPTAEGVLVISTDSNGPAAKAGIHGDSGGTKNPVGDGDIITAVNGKQVSSVAEVTSDIAQYSVGSSVDLTVLRKGKPIHVKVTLGAFPTNLPSQSP